jgi:hypothetical protein
MTTQLSDEPRRVLSREDTRKSSIEPRLLIASYCVSWDCTFRKSRRRRVPIPSEGNKSKADARFRNRPVVQPALDVVVGGLPYCSLEGQLLRVALRTRRGGRKNNDRKKEECEGRKTVRDPGVRPAVSGHTPAHSAVGEGLRRRQNYGRAAGAGTCLFRKRLRPPKASDRPRRDLRGRFPSLPCFVTASPAIVPDTPVAYRSQ